MICKNECECDESIKKYWDDIWLNPKCYVENGQSAAKLPTIDNTKLMYYNIGRKFNDYSR